MTLNKLFEEIVVGGGKKPNYILKNPPYSEVRELLKELKREKLETSLRLIYDPIKKDFYIWGAYYYTHDEGEEKLKLGGRNVYVYIGDINERYWLIEHGKAQKTKVRVDIIKIIKRILPGYKKIG